MHPDQIQQAIQQTLARMALGLPAQASPSALVAGYRATSSTPSALSYSGPGSLFGALGLERDVISTRTQPFGLADKLPVQLTDTLWPQFAYFTGFAASTGSEPVNVCDDPPTAGAGAVCVQTAQFGRFSRQSRVLDISNMNRRINRAEMTDLNLLNGPLVGGMGGLTVPGSAGSEFNIRNEAYMRMAELGVDFQLWFSRMIYEGNPANNTGGNGYREFPGLDILIGTGHVDANTNTACPSLDSTIVNLNYANVSISNSAMSNFIAGLTNLMRYMKTKAAGQNMGEVNWALVMRPGLFYELTAAWPCNYATYRCIAVQNINGQATGNGAFINGMDMAQMRDAMRNGSYLVIDGQQIQVIQDNTIREDTNTINSSVTNGSFASDVYFLPLSVRGVSTLFWEVFDFSKSLGDLPALAPGAGAYYWTDGGRYLWHLKPPANWCVQVMGLIQPRIILRTPHLAARITNVAYQTVMHEPDSDPTDPYFVRGGVTAGYTAPTFHAAWGTVS